MSHVGTDSFPWAGAWCRPGPRDAQVRFSSVFKGSQSNREPNRRFGSMISANQNAKFSSVQRPELNYFLNRKEFGLLRPSEPTVRFENGILANLNLNFAFGSVRSAVNLVREPNLGMSTCIETGKIVAHTPRSKKRCY
jgi:hypothetical protein